MKIWKLVAGILSCILFFVLVLQSCAAGISNALAESNETSGTTGVIVAIFMLAGGIVSIVTRKSEKKGGNIALIILFGLASFVGYIDYGTFTDLKFWAGWCLINAVIAFIALFIGRKKKSPENSVKIETTDE